MSGGRRAGSIDFTADLVALLHECSSLSHHLAGRVATIGDAFVVFQRLEPLLRGGGCHETIVVGRGGGPHDTIIVGGTAALHGVDTVVADERFQLSMLLLTSTGITTTNTTTFFILDRLRIVVPSAMQ